jgi:hypothetical protein
MFQFIKIVIICITIVGCVYLYIYYSPYQTFMRDCRFNEFLEGDFSDEFCTWKYFELIKEDSWLELIY